MGCHFSLIFKFAAFFCPEKLSVDVKKLISMEKNSWGKIVAKRLAVGLGSTIRILKISITFFFSCVHLQNG